MSECFLPILNTMQQDCTVAPGWNISFGNVKTASNVFSLRISSLISFITPFVPIAHAIGNKTANVAWWLIEFKTSAIYFTK